MLDEAVTLARMAGDRSLLGYVLDSRGAVAEARGDLELAAGLYQETLALAREIDDPIVATMALNALATVAARRGQPESAARILGAASARREAIGTPMTTTDDEARVAEAVSAARELLGEGAFAAAWEEGRVLPFEQAVAQALTLGNELAMGTPTKNEAG